VRAQLRHPNITENDNPEIKEFVKVEHNFFFFPTHMRVVCHFIKHLSRSSKYNHKRWGVNTPNETESS
jgi:hypothetical protein